ncbi:MAG: ABC transporter permease [Patescibacteria group bacterium]
MVEILKNMFRRKTRTILTISGITIGIFAFVVMGSMAEKINLLVSGGTKYYKDKVIVSDKSGNAFMGAPLSIEKVKDIEKVEGVQVVQSDVTVMLEDLGTVNFGVPPMIIGSDNKGASLESFKVEIVKGKELKPDDYGKVQIGSDLVKKLNAGVGKKIKIKGKEFEVKGIMGKTLTAPDNEVFMTLRDAQEIYHDTLPQVIQSQVKPELLVTDFTVYAKKGVDPNELAKKISKEVAGVKGEGPKAFQDQVASATGILNSILFGIAAISLLVGGLSIINTMTMSIAERTKEIGIKKAVGAKTRNIMTEYLTEAGLIGFFGGVIGWALGAATVVLINNAMEASGNVIFLLTTRISVFAIAFAVILGVLAGIYPAYHAVRINIVKALREE